MVQQAGRSPHAAVFWDYEGRAAVREGHWNFQTGLCEALGEPVRPALDGLHQRAEQLRLRLRGGLQRAIDRRCLLGHRRVRERKHVRPSRVAHVWIPTSAR